MQGGAKKNGCPRNQGLHFPTLHISLLVVPLPSLNRPRFPSAALPVARKRKRPGGEDACMRAHKQMSRRYRDNVTRPHVCIERRHEQDTFK